MLIKSDTTYFTQTTCISYKFTFQVCAVRSVKTTPHVCIIIVCKNREVPSKTLRKLVVIIHSIEYNTMWNLLNFSLSIRLDIQKSHLAVRIFSVLINILGPSLPYNATNASKISTIKMFSIMYLVRSCSSSSPTGRGRNPVHGAAPSRCYNVSLPRPVHGRISTSFFGLQLLWFTVGRRSFLAKNTTRDTHYQNK